MSDEREWYPYFAAVRPRAGSDLRWRDDLRARLAVASRRDCLDATGELRASARPTGRYQLLEVGEVEARWGAAPWFEVDSNCRFVGPVAGFLNWESWMKGKDELAFAYTNRAGWPYLLVFGVD